jgi:hypothetical protein
MAGPNSRSQGSEREAYRDIFTACLEQTSHPDLKVLAPVRLPCCQRRCEYVRVRSTASSLTLKLCHQGTRPSRLLAKFHYSKH